MKQVRNLKDELVKVAASAAGHKQDHRFNPWAKPVKRVDMSLSNGYCFIGDFVPDGTIEVEIKPTVFLVMTSSGSRKYQVNCYNIVVMDAEGNLTATDIQTDGQTRGWALRIRQQVADLLKEMAGEANPRDGFMATLRNRFPALTEAEIIIAALNVYEMHTR